MDDLIDATDTVQHYARFKTAYSQLHNAFVEIEGVRMNDGHIIFDTFVPELNQRMIWFVGHLHFIFSPYEFRSFDWQFHSFCHFGHGCSHNRTLQLHHIQYDYYAIEWNWHMVVWAIQYVSYWL